METRPARPVDAPAIARAQVEAWRSTYRGILPESALVDLSGSTQAQMWTQVIDAADAGAAVFVATDSGDAVVGFAAAGPARDVDPRFTGEVYALHVRPADQRRGAGRALLHEAVMHLERVGHPAFVAWVLAPDPALGFWTRMGGVRLKSRKVRLAGQYVDEVAFAWDRGVGRAGREDEA